nr:hypothetical protein [uncultured Mediterranean phage uvMED]
MKPLPVNEAFSKLSYQDYPKQIVDGKISWEWISKHAFPSSKLNFEPHSICRLRCPGCFMREDGLHQKGSKKYFDDGWDKRYTIPLEKYKIVFEVFKYMEFCGNLSDPIYHPEFVDTLKYLKGKGTKINFRTNGSGKSKKWWKEVFELCEGENWWWTFALDGLPEDSHIYRKKQNGEQVWEIMKYGKTLGAEIEWQWIVFKYNQNDLDHGQLLADQHNIQFNYYHSTRWSTPELKALKPSGPHGHRSRATQDAMNQVKKYNIDLENIIKVYAEDEDDFWNDYDNYEGPRFLPKDDHRIHKVEIDPDCLNIHLTKPLMFNSMGYFIPCCEMDQRVDVLTERGFYKEEFHIDNLHTVEDIKNVFMSDVWQDHYMGLLNNPEGSPEWCQRFCAKNEDVHIAGHGTDNHGFV